MYFGDVVMVDGVDLVWHVDGDVFAEEEGEGCKILSCLYPGSLVAPCRPERAA